MKRVILILCLLFVAAMFVFADDAAVIPEVDITPASMDNMKIGETITVDGLGRLTFAFADYVDYIHSYKKDKTHISRYDNDCLSSGSDAEYYVIYADIINTSLDKKNYLSDYSVTATYDDVYQFTGWAHQLDWNNTYQHFDDGYSRVAYIHDDNQFEIEPMYAGHYVFGVALPNAVVDGEEPLSIMIRIEDDCFTYNIR